MIRRDISQAPDATHYCAHCGLTMQPADEVECPACDGDLCEPRCSAKKVGAARPRLPRHREQVRLFTPIEISPGAIVVKRTHAEVKLRHDDIIVVELDLSSKYAEVSGFGDVGCPTVDLARGERTVNADKRHVRDTVVRFVEFPNWTVYVASVGRYMLRVVLRPDEKEIPRD